jgi:hypothetical protein
VIEPGFLEVAVEKCGRAPGPVAVSPLSFVKLRVRWRGRQRFRSARKAGPPPVPMFARIGFRAGSFVSGALGRSDLQIRDWITSRKGIVNVH